MPNGRGQMELRIAISPKSRLTFLKDFLWFLWGGRFGFGVVLLTVVFGVIWVRTMVVIEAGLLLHICFGG